MKKLTLNDNLKSKLDRLSVKVGKLHYLGEDVSTYGSAPIVAIVGTRKPTPYGKTITEELANGLARAGVVVISGNAFGVDAIAEKAALDANGKVIAVVASGLDKVYPATNKPIADMIVKKGGAIISEYEPGHNPRPEEFLHRNRIIAALSDLVIIPEAAERSGSLNTAKHAKQMNIPIGAVPGPVTSSMSSGTNKLLKDGAHIIRNVDDILELLNIDTSQKQMSLNLEGDNETQTAILKAIDGGAVDPHEIQLKTGLSATEFQMAVTMLEVSGRITSSDLKGWRLV